MTRDSHFADRRDHEEIAAILHNRAENETGLTELQSRRLRWLAWYVEAEHIDALDARNRLFWIRKLLRRE